MIFEFGKYKVDVDVEKTKRFYEKAETFAISDDFHVSFQNEVAMLETDFPLPVIQLEFSVNMPWVLEKENSYR